MGLDLLQPPAIGHKRLAPTPVGTDQIANLELGVAPGGNHPADGASLQKLSGHTSNVESVAFAPDGQSLASGSTDGTVRLWGLR